MKKGAFTLAEVLITLGIIGIVAAMTIPTLLANTRSQQYRSRFKKAVSTLSQAARLSQSLYGFDYAGLNTECGTNDHPDSVQSICALLNGTLSGMTYFPDASQIPMKNSDKKYSIDSPYINQYSTANMSTVRAYVLSDGVIVGFHRQLGVYPCELKTGVILKDVYRDTGSMSKCYGFIDVNGTDLPNKEVSCSSGENTLSKNTCVVKNDAEHMTDVYPVRFHDGIVVPATAAARYVLNSAK